MLIVSQYNFKSTIVGGGKIGSNSLIFPYLTYI